MTTEEKLNRIRAKCVELLAIAEKRTPGVWTSERISYRVHYIGGDHSYPPIAEMMTHTSHERDSDAAFIAACAGPAEAGWRTTITAIDTCLEQIKNGGMNSLISGQTHQIIAAWEGIL